MDSYLDLRKKFGLSEDNVSSAFNTKKSYSDVRTQFGLETPKATTPSLTPTVNTATENGSIFSNVQKSQTELSKHHLNPGNKVYSMDPVEPANDGKYGEDDYNYEKLVGLNLTDDEKIGYGKIYTDAAAAKKNYNNAQKAYNNYVNYGEGGKGSSFGAAYVDNVKAAQLKAEADAAKAEWDSLEAQKSGYYDTIVAQRNGKTTDTMTAGEKLARTDVNELFDAGKTNWWGGNSTAEHTKTTNNGVPATRSAKDIEADLEAEKKARSESHDEGYQSRFGSWLEMISPFDWGSGQTEEEYQKGKYQREEENTARDKRIAELEDELVYAKIQDMTDEERSANIESGKKTAAGYSMAAADEAAKKWAETGDTGLHGTFKESNPNGVKFEDVMLAYLMTDAEKENYYALLGTDVSSAERYLELLRINKGYDEKLAELTAENTPAAIKPLMAVGKGAKSAVEDALGVGKILKQDTRQTPDQNDAISSALQKSVMTEYPAEEGTYALKNPNVAYAPNLKSKGLALANSIGYQLPSMYLSAVTGSSGGLLGSLGVGEEAAAKAGQLLGSTQFAVQAGTSAYKEAVNNGHSAKEATQYAIAQAADEAVTNFLLNGVNKLGGGALTKLAGKSVEPMVESAIGKVFKSAKGQAIASSIAKLFGESMGEGAQEFLQYFTEGLQKEIFLNEDFDINSEEAIEEAIMGILSAGILNVSTGSLGKNYSDSINNKYYEAAKDIYEHSEDGIDQRKYKSFTEEDWNTVADYLEFIEAVEKTNAEGVETETATEEPVAEEPAAEVKPIEFAEEFKKKKAEAEQTEAEQNEQPAPAETVQAEPVAEVKEEVPATAQAETTEEEENVKSGSTAERETDLDRHAELEEAQRSEYEIQSERKAEIGNLKETSYSTSRSEDLVSGGTEKAVRIASKEYLKENKWAAKIVAENAANGVKTTITFDNIEVTDEDGNTYEVRSFISDDGKSIVINANNDNFTAEQLNRHENYHREAKNNPDMVSAVREKLKGYTDQQMVELANEYAEAYSFLDDTDAVLEEIYADIYADMALPETVHAGQEVKEAVKTAYEESKSLKLKKPGETNTGAKNSREMKQDTGTRTAEKRDAKTSISELKADIRKDFSFPTSGTGKAVRAIESAATEILKTGKITSETRDRLLETLYDTGEVIFRYGDEEARLSLRDVAEMKSETEGTGSGDEYLDRLGRKLDNALRKFAYASGIEVNLRQKISQETKDRIARQDMSAKNKQVMRDLQKIRKKFGQNDSKLAAIMDDMDPEDRAVMEDAIKNIATSAQRLTAKAKEKMQLSKENYEFNLEKDPNFIPTKQDLEGFENIDRDFLRDKTIEELQNYHRVITECMTHLSNMDREMGKERREKFSSLFNSSMGEIRAAQNGRTKTTVDKKTGEKVEKSAGIVDRFLDEQQLSALNFIEMLSGWDENSVFYNTVGKQLEEGERAAKQIENEMTDMVKDFNKKHKDWVAKSDGQGKDAIWHEIKVRRLLGYTEEGHRPIYGGEVTVQVTPAMMVELARGTRNLDNLRHAEGGVTFPKKAIYETGDRQAAYKEVKPIRLSPETMKETFNYDKLDATEKELYDLMDKVFDDYSKKKINETSQLVDGVDKTISDHYSKIYTNSNYRATDTTIDLSMSGGLGSLKSRQRSSTPMLAMSVWDAFNDNKETVKKYCGMYIPVQNAQKLLNWIEDGNTLKQEISEKYGATAEKYIENLFAELSNKQSGDGNDISKAFGKVLNAYITGTFGLNPGIVIKQFASFPSVAAALGFDTVPSPKQIASVDVDLINKYTPELAYRFAGWATPELAELKKNPNWTQKNKVTRFLFGGAIQGMDYFTVKSMWPWAENYVDKHNTDLKHGSDEYYKEVAKVYNKAVVETQPMYDTMHRAGIMRSSNEATKALTMFKTVPMQQQQMIRKAYNEWKYAQGTEAKKGKAKAIGRTVASLIASNVLFEGIEFLNQLWKNKAKGYKDDDDDELTAKSIGTEIAKGVIEDFVGTVIGGDEAIDAINLVNNISTGISNGFADGFSLESPTLSVIGDLVNTVLTFAGNTLKLGNEVKNVIADGGDVGQYIKDNSQEIIGNIKDTVSSYALLTKGLPTSNFEKYLLGTISWISPEVAEEIKTIYDKTNKSDLKGLKDEQLKVRINDLVSRRFEVDDKSVDELKRLYENGNSNVIPTAVSTSLSEKEKQDYNAAYSKTMNGQLKKLFAKSEYKSMTDSQKASAIRCMYNVAAKVATVKIGNGDEDDRNVVEKWNEAKSLGMSVADYAAAKTKLNSLGSKEEKIKYIKTQPSSYRKYLWQLAGYSESTYEKSFGSGNDLSLRIP